ncbi:MAG: hypothetical protein ACI9Y7_001750 [Dokdonia sp.]|jgi:hypothetical protein
MGAYLQIFHLYKLTNGKALLLKISRSGYSNSNQHEENKALKNAISKQELLLKKYIETQKTSIEKYIGEFQGLPEGAILYDKYGKTNLKNLWFTKTTYGHPWIFISIASNSAEFWSITTEEGFADNGMSKIDLIPPAIHIETTDFITEYDFDLSSIPNAYAIDIAP